MLNLVEAPVGHVAGTLVISSVNDDGQRIKDVVHNVSGSVYQDGVSLQVDNGILEHPSNLIGKLHGDILSLAFGGTNVSFQRMSQSQYDATLSALDSVAGILKNIAAAKAAVAKFESEQTQLGRDLNDFVAWSGQRIQHNKDVREWYARRIDKYQKCLDTIAPLAAQKVPVWKWQDCAIAIENDKYDREQQITALTDNQKNEKLREKTLSSKIADFKNQVTELSDTWYKACSAVKDTNTCEQQMTAFKVQSPQAFENSKPVVDYLAILPGVRKALDDDMQAGLDGEQTLSVIAGKTSALYRNSSGSD